MIQNLILSIGLSFAIGLNGAKDNHDNFINNDTPNNVVYDDEDYSITLTANEVNNYVWNNLYTLANTDYTFDDLFTSIGYDDLSYPYGNNETSGPYWINGENYINFITNYDDYNSNNENANLTKNYIFVLQTIDSSNERFESDLTINCESIYYENIKNAIELDIQANTTQASMGNTIINAIKSGLGLIGDLAAQFLLGFSTLFWANNSLTPFGTFALVFLGIAITMAVVSLVLNTIRNNTGA